MVPVPLSFRMHHALLVFLGGGLGSLSRYIVSLGVVRMLGPMTRPGPADHLALPPTLVFLLATMTVNVVGCLLIGLAWGRLGLGMREEARLLLIVGFLGGFTTFSAIGWDGFALLCRGQPGAAGLYILLTVALGLAAVWLGHTLGQSMSPAPPAPAA